MKKLYTGLFQQNFLKARSTVLAGLLLLGGSLTSITTSAQDCTPQNVPYLETFDDALNNELPACVTGEDTNGDTFSWFTITAAEYPTQFVVYSYNDDGVTPADDWFFTKGLNLTAGISYRVRFKYGADGPDYVENLEVKFGQGNTSADMTSATIFTAEGIDNAFGTPLTQGEVFFTPTQTGVYYVGFHAYSEADMSALLMDDIEVDLAPTCFPPINIAASNVTTTSATITWEAPATSTPASYDVYYTTSSTAPDGTTVPNVAGIAATTTNLTDLVGASTYYVWIRSNCGGGDYSVWALLKVSSGCTAVDVPYLENFDDATTPDVPNCTGVDDANGDAVTWGTFLSADVPLPVNLSTTSVRYSYNLDAVTPADDWFFTKGLNLTAGIAYRVRFKYKSSNTDFTEKLELKFGQGNTAGDMSSAAIFTDEEINKTTFEDPYLDATTYFTPTETGVYYVGFHCYSDADQAFLYVDDIQVDVAPSCLPPTNISVSSITVNSALVSWTAPVLSVPGAYEVYYSKSNTAPDASTVPSVQGVDGTSTALSGLDEASVYYVWVRSNCGNGDLSEWSAYKQFKTACTATDVPYYENFDGVTVPELPDCTSQENVNGDDSQWITTDNTTYVFADGAQALVYLWNADNVANDWFFTKGLNLSADKTYTLKFRYKASASAFTEKIRVRFGNEATAVGMTSAIIFTDNSANGINSAEVDFQPTQTGVTYLGFRAASDADQFYLTVDDISVEEKATVPVTLSPLAGERKNGINELSWNTYTEAKNKGFEVQRSIDGSHFATIAFVATKAQGGISNQKISYSFTDDASFKVTGYYRLKQVDVNGASKQSNTVTIKSDKVNALEISQAYPNPAKNELNLVVATPQNNNIQIEITDLSGRVVLQQRSQLTSGDNVVKLNTSLLSQGTYLVKAISQNGNSTLVRKFVKL